jgi:hypothetical protein
VLAEHLTKSGIAVCAGKANSIVWHAQEDNSSCPSLDKAGSNSLGLARSFTGLVESGNHPDATGDQVWMVVKRTIGGAASV